MQLVTGPNPKYVDHSLVSIIAGTGLTGGGDLTASRTLDVSATYATISANDLDTDVTGAELEELTDGSETTLHSHPGGGGYTDEQAQDAVGGMLVDTDTIDLTYIDLTPALKADLRYQDTASIDLTVDAFGLKATVLPAGVDHDSLSNYVADKHVAHSTWAGSANITTLGTIVTGVWNGTDIAIADGGTGQSTAQLAINALTAVAGATNEHVLTKDTVTGDAVWKAAVGGLAFKTITGITNDIVADAADDTLTLASANAGLTIVGTAASDTITFTAVPQNPSCIMKASRTTSQTIPNDTYTKLQFATENWDVGSNYDNATNYRFVAPATGYYLVTVSVFLTDISNGKKVNAAIYLNGTLVSVKVEYNASGGTASMVAKDLAEVYLTSGQYIEGYCYHNNGNDRVIGLSLNATFMTVHRIME